MPVTDEVIAISLFCRSTNEPFRSRVSNIPAVTPSIATVVPVSEPVTDALPKEVSGAVPPDDKSRFLAFKAVPAAVPDVT